MKKRYNTRRITSLRSYSTLELADLLGTHPQTIREWRTKGLCPIDELAHSSLYIGRDVKHFLERQKLERKVVLGPDEYYCLHCKSATRAVTTSFVDSGNKIGHNISSVIRNGVCEKCGTRVRRFDTSTINLLTKGKGISIEHPTSL